MPRPHPGPAEKERARRRVPLALARSQTPAAYRVHIVHLLNTCISAAVGTTCALAGVYAGPQAPERINLDHALAALAAATTAACAWSLWQHQLTATMLTFTAITYTAGQLRTRRPSHDPEHESA